MIRLISGPLQDTQLTSLIKSLSFPSLWPIKRNPNRKVLEKILKPVHLASGNKQERPNPDRTPAPSIEKETRPTSDKVNLIPRMGFLRIMAGGNIKLHHQRPMRKNGHSQIARRRRTLRQGLGQPNMNGSCERFHTRRCAGSNLL